MELYTEEELQEFLSSVAFRFCPNCGEPIVQPPRGRKKIFCSERCRREWDNSHPKPENWKRTRTATCPICGRSFTASREYTRQRRYCSHACANKARRKDWDGTGRSAARPVSDSIDKENRLDPALEQSGRCHPSM